MNTYASSYKTFSEQSPQLIDIPEYVSFMPVLSPDSNPSSSPSPPSFEPTPTPALKRKRASHLANTPPRPPNSFMIFRQEFMSGLVFDWKIYQAQFDAISEKEKKLRSSFWTKVASKVWNEAPTNIRQLYHTKAEEKKAQHAKIHPDYRYQPQRRSAPVKRVGSAEKTKKRVSKKRSTPYERYMKSSSSPAPSSPASSGEAYYSPAPELYLASESSSPEPYHFSPETAFDNQLYLPNDSTMSDEYRVTPTMNTFVPPISLYAGSIGLGMGMGYYDESESGVRGGSYEMMQRGYEVDSSAQFNDIDSLVSDFMGDFFHIDAPSSSSSSSSPSSDY